MGWDSSDPEFRRQQLARIEAQAGQVERMAEEARFHPDTSDPFAAVEYWSHRAEVADERWLDADAAVRAAEVDAGMDDGGGYRSLKFPTDAQRGAVIAAEEARDDAAREAQRCRVFRDRALAKAEEYRAWIRGDDLS